MKVKSAPARFKADGDGATATGEFEAIVSVFGNVDSWGDVVKPGAFKDSIEQWKSSPNTLPVLWSHRMDDPTFNIGEVLEIKEFEAGADGIPDWVDQHVKDNGGLYVKGRIDTGADASPIAVQALRLLKSRRVTQFSYAYDEEDSGPVDLEDGTEAWELRKLTLYEVSPTQIGANNLTELIGAKAHRSRKAAFTTAELEALSGALEALALLVDEAEVTDAEPGDDGEGDQAPADAPAAGSLDEATKRRRKLAALVAAARLKVGRTLSQKNEDRIKQAVDLLTETLSSLESDTDSDKAKRREPTGAKREELARTSTASIRSLIDLAHAECAVMD